VAEGGEETRARSNARTTASLRKKVGAQWHWDWMLRGYYLMREQNNIDLHYNFICPDFEAELALYPIGNCPTENRRHRVTHGQLVTTPRGRRTTAVRAESCPGCGQTVRSVPPCTVAAATTYRCRGSWRREPTKGGAKPQDVPTGSVSEQLVGPTSRSLAHTVLGPDWSHGSQEPIEAPATPPPSVCGVLIGGQTRFG